jgi:hypothetical protein
MLLSFSPIGFILSSQKYIQSFYFPAGDANVSFVDLRDVVAIAVKILTEGEYDFDSRYNKK